MEKHDKYISPLGTRYASSEMSYLFSEEKKFKTWRLLWISLAKAEKKLGLDITDEQIADLEKHKDDINFDEARKKEAEVRHDVMSHVYAYGLQATKAAGIIHLGATSCYVGDNTELILMKEALLLIQTKLLNVINLLATFAGKYKSVPTLGYTHFQPAQPTTIGKRATLWLYDIYNDYLDLSYVIDTMKFLGSKGTTGTQASFVELFSKDGKLTKEVDDACKKIDELIAEDFGFDKNSIVKVSGQTYSRKEDFKVLSVLSQIAQSAHKFSNDIRLLAHLKEIEEPFEKNQIGSSAMPYKRNPMRCERMASLANYVCVSLSNASITSSTQWLERTLDDSANKRISIPECFMAVDGILNLYMNICDGLVVNEGMVKKHLDDELPFMMTENIMMKEVENGASRQEVHEIIRKLSMEAGKNVKEGRENNLLDLIDKSTDLHINKAELEKLKDGTLYIGRAEHQVDDLLNETIKPLLDKNKNKLGLKSNISV